MPDSPDDGTFIRITNREIYLRLEMVANELRTMTSDVRQAVEGSLELGKRVRSLELKFYGVLAGLVAAITIIIGLIFHSAING
jgi:hypothetical protein